MLIGTPDNTLGAELHLVQSILARGCPTQIVDRLQDAVHTKIVINLTNALDALVGRGWRPAVEPRGLSVTAVADLVGGRVRIIRAAGYREYRIAGIPSFAFLRLAALLPGWLLRPVFKSKTARLWRCRA